MVQRGHFDAIVVLLSISMNLSPSLENCCSTVGRKIIACGKMAYAAISMQQASTV